MIPEDSHAVPTCLTGLIGTRTNSFVVLSIHCLGILDFTTNVYCSSSSVLLFIVTYPSVRTVLYVAHHLFTDLSKIKITAVDVISTYVMIKPARCRFILPA